LSEAPADFHLMEASFGKKAGCSTLQLLAKIPTIQNKTELLEKYTMFHLKSIFEQHLCTNDGSKSDNTPIY